MAEQGSVERQQRADLRRMKALATAFLLGATAVFVLTLHRDGWVGYLNAAAEAGMVGALADWFAVTALFRHPLGLPIPHTAIIPTRKDALGRNLQRFVTTNFLSEEIVRDKVRRLEVGGRLGGWLAEPTHASRVSAELATAARAALTVLRDEDVQQVLEQTVVRRLAEIPWGPPLGRLLGQLVSDGAHHRLVDVAVGEAHAWLTAHEDVVVEAVLDQAPAWTPQWVDTRVAHRVYAELLRFVGEIRDDPEHRVRLAVDHYLLTLAKDLRDDPETRERVEQMKAAVLAHPGVREATAALWSTARRVVLEAVDDPDSTLRTRVADGLAALGRRLAGDTELRGKVDAWAEDAAAYAVNSYGEEITAVISDTVERWDAQETARRVELQVGRDLQFIRINGTVVGALAGLAIHTAARLL